MFRVFHLGLPSGTEMHYTKFRFSIVYIYAHMHTRKQALLLGQTTQKKSNSFFYHFSSVTMVVPKISSLRDQLYLENRETTRHLSAHITGCTHSLDSHSLFTQLTHMLRKKKHLKCHVDAFADDTDHTIL